MKRTLPALLAFFVLAFAISWLANTFLPALSWKSLDLKLIVTGFGPAISGVVCYQIFKVPSEGQISLFGDKPPLAVGVCVLAIILPILLTTSSNKSLVFAFALTQFLYCIGEELGWRHYLQNATSELGKSSRWKQSFLIGTIWFFWHYAIMSNPTQM